MAALQRALRDGSLTAPPGGVDFFMSVTDDTRLCRRSSLLEDCPVPVLANIRNVEYQVGGIDIGHVAYVLYFSSNKRGEPC